MEKLYCNQFFLQLFQRRFCKLDHHWLILTELSYSDHLRKSLRVNEMTYQKQFSFASLNYWLAALHHFKNIRTAILHETSGPMQSSILIPDPTVTILLSQKISQAEPTNGPQLLSAHFFGPSRLPASWVTVSLTSHQGMHRSPLYVPLQCGGTCLHYKDSICNPCLTPTRYW